MRSDRLWVVIDHIDDVSLRGISRCWSMRHGNNITEAFDERRPIWQRLLRMRHTEMSLLQWQWEQWACYKGSQIRTTPLRFPISYHEPPRHARQSMSYSTGIMTQGVHDTWMKAGFAAGSNRVRYGTTGYWWSGRNGITVSCDKDCQDGTVAGPAIEKNVETHIYRSVCVSGFSVKRMTAIRNGFGGICYEDMTIWRGG